MNDIKNETRKMYFVLILKTISRTNNQRDYNERSTAASKMPVLAVLSKVLLKAEK